jgi:hypothetical protein
MFFSGAQYEQEEAEAAERHDFDLFLRSLCDLLFKNDL